MFSKIETDHIILLLTNLQWASVPLPVKSEVFVTASRSYTIWISLSAQPVTHPFLSGLALLQRSKHAFLLGPLRLCSTRNTPCSLPSLRSQPHLPQNKLNLVWWEIQAGSFPKETDFKILTSQSGLKLLNQGCPNSYCKLPAMKKKSSNFLPYTYMKVLYIYKTPFIRML